MQLSNWGNYPQINATMRSFDNVEKLRSFVNDWNAFIPRGMGRCYGDSALNSHVVSTLRYNRILDFNEETGEIRCEGGVTLAELLEVFVPRGWFLPVTPGTKFVTVGGAIAADVHGKNHHRDGSFSRHLTSMEVLTGDGNVLNCSREENSELFWLTCGGMGLTGIILNATFQLKPVETAYIRQKSLRTKNLDEVLDRFEESTDCTYSVAWIDCLAKGANMGRSIILSGEHATVDDLKAAGASVTAPLQTEEGHKLKVPFSFPGWVLNPLTIRTFNALYYGKHAKSPTETLLRYDAFFYPLDGIHHWNRIYGKKGFTQYQFVLPKDRAREGMKKILSCISEEGTGSFLAVLKAFGPGDPGILSFPMEGITLALDFAIRPGLFTFLDELDRIVLDFGGRIYLAKDARMGPEMFQKSYENSAAFIEGVKCWNNGTFRSNQSTRIHVTP